jgi:hypothetical protein
VGTGNLGIETLLNQENLAMASEPQTQQPLNAADPHTVAETVCDGPLNVQLTGNRATLTFTHLRAKTALLLERGHVDFEAIVRARIVFSMETLIDLRNVLNKLVPDKSPTEGATATSIGGTKPH